MSDNPILLTPDDVGTEMMTREGRAVEVLEHNKMGGHDLYLFSDLEWRWRCGSIVQGKLFNKDIVSRISEQVS